MTLKKTLLAGAAGAALFAFAAPVAAPAEAAGMLKNGAPTDVTIYGQVDRAMLFYDDGEETGYRNVDANNSSTRFGFKAKGKVNEEVSMGAQFEVELKSNDSSSTSISQTSENASPTLNERHMYVYIQHKQFGTVKLGQTSSISDGMSDGLDLSGSAFAFAGMDPRLTANGFKFRNDNTAKSLSTATIGKVFTTLDGGRQDEVRYETPVFNGVQLVTGLYTSGDWGVGAYYNNKFGAFKVRGTAFYENLSGTGDVTVSATTVFSTTDQWQVGASVMHDSGISLTGLYGQRSIASEANKPNGKVWEVRVGYTANMNSLGPTGIGVTYEGSKELDGVRGSDGTAYGFGVNQDIKSAGANLFGNVMVWSRGKGDSETTDTKDIVTFIMGGRVKF